MPWQRGIRLPVKKKGSSETVAESWSDVVGDYIQGTETSESEEFKLCRSCINRKSGMDGARRSTDTVRPPW